MTRSARFAVTVAWGDCDPAGIVYYPNYFRWIDSATWNLFESVGNGWDRLQRTFGPFQIPLLEARCAFRSPCRRGDVLTVESRVTAWDRKVFSVEHRLLDGGEAVMVEGSEIRCWTRPDEADGGRLRSAPIPDGLIALFGGPRRA